MNKRDIFLAVFSGILLTVIFPKINLGALGWICLVPLLFAVDKKEPSKGFLLGAIAGTVFHMGLIYWVTVAMTVYGGLPLVLSLLVLILFSVFLGLFIAAPLYGSCYAQKYLNWGFLLTLPFFWTTAEYIKSWFFTGFPWGPLAYSQYQTLHVIQIADVTGMYGISFLVVLINCTFFSIFSNLLEKKRIPYNELIVTVVLLTGTLVYGHKKLDDEKKTEHRGPVKLAIIQPNISQDIKWDPQALDETMNTFERLTHESAAVHPDMVLWPESATPFFFQSEPQYKKIVSDIAKGTGAYLLFGSPSWTPGYGVVKYFNSAFLFSPKNGIVGRYDKVHLVPYGEYVPLKQLFPFIQKMVVGLGDFSPGMEIKNLDLQTSPFGTLICYEIIFPDLVRRFVKKGATFLVNITNDAWYGRTSAPHQHLSMGVLRAVENRRYIARAANTGISAFIAPDGRIVKQTKLFTQAVLPAIIFKRTEKTSYSLYGDVFAILCSVVTALFVLAARIRKKSLKKNHL